MNTNEIKNWMKSEKITCVELARRIHVTRQHLSSVLRGVYPLTPRLEQAIEREMQGGVYSQIPDEIREKIEQWAEQAKVNFSDMVDALLAECLGVKSVSPRAVQYLRDQEKAAITPRDGQDYAEEWDEMG